MASKGLEMRRAVVWSILVASLVAVGVLAAVVYAPQGGGASSTSSASGAGGVAVARVLSPAGTPAGGWLKDDPSISTASLTVDYPPGYGALANYTLGLINQDRATSGLGALSLGNVPSGQQHADSMAYFGYFSHWDVQGYKPYMRYTLVGGTGSVEENLALSYCTSSGALSPCTIKTVENAINASEWDMMNNDTQCCGGGHRENILGPFHNQVSLGIAYNSTTVFLVEDFEDTYIGSESLQLASGTVSLNGTLPQVPYTWMTRQAGAEILVYYDPTPTPISRAQLDQVSACSQYSELNESTACRYQGAYNPGTEVSAVFEPCPQGKQCAAGSYIYAQTWQYDPKTGDFSIVFSMSALEAAHGSGVYTLYLWPSERAPEAMTSLSLFVAGG